MRNAFALGVGLTPTVFIIPSPPMLIFSQGCYVTPTWDQRLVNAEGWSASGLCCPYVVEVLTTWLAVEALTSPWSDNEHLDLSAYGEGTISLISCSTEAKMLIIRSCG